MTTRPADALALVIDQLRRRGTPLGDQIADDIAHRYPPIDPIYPRGDRDILRDLYEALTDALVHAKAAQVRSVADEDLLGLLTVLMGWCNTLRDLMNQREAVETVPPIPSAPDVLSTEAGDLLTALQRSVDDDKPRLPYGASCAVHGQWMRSWRQVDADAFRGRHEMCAVRPVRVHMSPGTVYPDRPWRAGCKTHGSIRDFDGPLYVSRELALLAAEAHLKAKHARGEA